MRLTALLLGATLSLLGVCFARPGATPESSALLSSVLFGMDMAPEAMLPKAKPPLQAALESYRKREGQFPMPKFDSMKEGPEKSQLLRKARYQRAIYSLFDQANALQLGTDFTENVPLIYEWEGMGDSPLSEAKFAAKFLKEHPKSDLAPYLHLFIGHREQCAAGFFGARESFAPGVSEDAKAHLKAALESKNILVKAVAEHLTEFGGCLPPGNR